MEGNKNISAFAFKTGRLIEDLIIKETNNLKEENQLLQARILNFYSYLIKESSEYYGVHDDITNRFEKEFEIIYHNKGE